MTASPSPADFVWVLASAALVMLMQGGFCLLETGFSRAKNSINVAIKNLIDFCLSSLVFWAFGFALMFGASQGGMIGGSGFALGAEASPWLMTLLLFQLMFCSTATTIISGAAAERLRFSVYLFVAVLVSGVIYPIFGHWAWGGLLEGAPTGWLAKLGFIDFAGSTAVHAVGGWVALALVLVLGPRRGRFDRAAPPMHGHSLVNATMGAFLLWFGWFGFNGGSTLGLTDKTPLILLNTNLAAAAGGIAALAAAWWWERIPNVGQMINGVLGGLVAVTAGCHLLSPVAAVAAGLAAGAITTFGSYLLDRLEIDDAVGAFPVHGLCGVLGTLLVALLGDAGQFTVQGGRGGQFLVQLLGVLSCAAWAFGFSYLCFRLLNRFCSLRVSEQAEKIGLNVAEHGAASELLDLLGGMHTQRCNGDFSQQVHVEPHTEVGEIAAEYNRVLARVSDEIRAREQAAEQARAAEEKYRSIFENAVEGIFQTTPQGAYLTANPKLAQIYGYDSPAELMQSLCDIQRQLYVDPTRRAEFQQLIATEGAVIGFESQVYRRDGSTIWIAENARAVRDEAGHIVRYEGTVEEITDRRRNAELLREIESAQAASQAKSAFLANMSHEIRTPLNGVIGMLELLGGTPLSERQQHYLRIARASSDTLLGLINDILDLSKIEAGSLELEQLQFDLHQLLEDVAEMFSHRAAAKRLELTCRIQPGVPSAVRGDPERLRQVLINLTNNALKFTERGEVRISAELIAGDHCRARMRIEVADTGIGIPEDRRHRLFAAFSQVDASTTRKYGGTGLGLAICKQIVELMGGAIDCHSKPGAGSTFWFEIEMERLEDHPPLPSALPAELLGLRVLVVDDTNTNLEILHEQLTRFGLEPKTLGDPHAALPEMERAAAHGLPYQLVILDHQMPLLDGLQLAESIQARPDLPPATLLMLTSAEMQIDREQARRYGLSRVLSKPLRQSRLLEELVQALQASRPREAAAPPSPAPGKPALPPGARILIAEDNEINQLVTREILRRAGVACDVANNGREATFALRERDYDLVLMDCQMPEMDGFAATEEIRRWEAERGKTAIPVVALTANAVRGDRERCLAAGMNDYVTKPIDPDALLQTVARWLKPAAPSAAAGESPPEAKRSGGGVGVVNLPEFLARCGGNEPFARQILGKFQQRLPRERERLREALAQRDSGEALRVAHTLKGVAGNLAAPAVEKLAGQIESQLRANPEAVGLEPIQQLDAKIEECLAAIEMLLQDSWRQEGVR